MKWTGENIMEKETLKPKNKIIDIVLIVVCCIAMALLSMFALKRYNVKKEYKNVVEKELENVKQEYDLDSAIVQIIEVEKQSNKYIFDVVINCKTKSPNETMDDEYYQNLRDSIKSAVNYGELPSGTLIDCSETVSRLKAYLNDETIIAPIKTTFLPSSSSDSETCENCGREFTDDANKKSIRHTNMCTNCYSNYQFGTAAQSAADQYGR